MDESGAAIWKTTSAPSKAAEKKTRNGISTKTYLFHIILEPTHIVKTYRLASG